MAPTDDRPNVILIMTDDQGYGDIGCLGNDIIRTPNLDQLHPESTRLTDFHVNPLCAPTRAALMTGRYCSRTGVWCTIRGRSLLRRDEVTMADVFAASGYRTGVFGKWHLGDNHPFRPGERGFQETLVHGGGGVCQTPDHWGNSYFDDTYLRNGALEPQQGYCTDVFFDAGMEFIEANRDQPFFVYLPTNAPHGPYLVDDKYAHPYREQGVPENRACFWGMITNIDENVGRLVAKLRELGLEENTIFIFMTDNGTSSGFDARTGEGYNAGMRATKGSQYDGGHRVPCFIRWPARLEPGRDIDTLAAHIDLLPTFIDLCGLVAPEGVEFDGTSLAPLLTGAAAGWPERTLCVDCQQIDYAEKWRRCAVMTQRWRLVDGKELYDIAADPGQTSDLSAEHPDVVAELRQAYEEWWADISERFDEYCEIVIGSDAENPSRLTAHDWHDAENVPWNHRQIQDSDLYLNGFWAIDVERDGRYEFILRRYPLEEDTPLEATTARLKIGDIDQTQSIDASAPSVTFEADLKAGKTRLQSWLTNDQTGAERGAYFIYARRL
ncbi:MAG: arylsulfatase [Candidatus Brocadiaceae bacterium]|jgi:arylsulfatase A-like enzyme